MEKQDTYVEFVKIGMQIWCKKNLEVNTYANGDTIPQVQDETKWGLLTTGAWCYYDNNEGYGTVYGKLYNWYALSDPRGLAPNGFHIPSDIEWTILSTSLGESEAGKKMKNPSGFFIGNSNNESGFTGLPGGFRNNRGYFYNFGKAGYWWSSTADGESSAWKRMLNFDNSILERHGSSKKTGFSIRCLKD